MFAAAAACLTAPATAGDRDESPDPVALWAALQDAGATLEAGLAVSAQRGTPVFAGFDFEDGDLALIVWVATTDGFAQVLLDPDTAAIVAVAPIDNPDDLADAAARKAAVDKGVRSLVSVVRDVLHANNGARAANVTPELHDGHPVAMITLLADRQFVKTSRWLE